MKPEREDDHPSDLGDDWLERLTEERRRRNPAYTELEVRLESEGPSFVVERMTDEDGRVLDEPQVVASSHPEDLEIARDSDRAVPSAYHAMGYENADGMERKAIIVRALAERIGALGLSRAEAASRLGLAENILNRLLKGRFLHNAEADLAALMDRLG